jgi:predicted helicase
MSTPEATPLHGIKTFPQLIKYLRDDLDWPIESEDVEDLTFDYVPEELGLDPRSAVKIKEIKQLRPLTTHQPWGIFFVNFEPKRLPVVALRRILQALVVKKRQSAKRPQQATWQLHDLLFISSYGETEHRNITFAHFSEDPGSGDLPVLRVLGWDDENTVLHLEHAHQTLQQQLRWPDHDKEAEEWRSSWASAFTVQHREVITTSRALAIRLADLARSIRKRVNAVLAVESAQGPLRRLHAAFREALIHDLDEDDFADTYAQTIAYGLLSARVSRPGGLVADDITHMVPVTNPFLKELLEAFLTAGGRRNTIDFDELGVTEVVALLREANMEAVLRDFGDRNPQEDPVLHFYESFLREYDARKRIQRGVFYTPRPVVSFIVRSVHQLLQKEFGLKDGLADTTTWAQIVARHPGMTRPPTARLEDPFVQILDPATGTGTFLVEVIDIIYKTMRAKWIKAGHMEFEVPNLWNEYVPKHLLPRLYGFELMMAPYAIAHMKIGLKLAETGYRFGSEERARIYLTNSLEPPHDFSRVFEEMAPALAHEARAANQAKSRVPTTVIIGNPPYSGISTNMNSWIDGLLKGQIPDGPKVRSYYEIDGKPLGEKKLWLQDDYVKFIRYGQWRVEIVGVGILSYISNHGYLDNPTFRGMRQQLLATFPSIGIIDLHGSAKKKQRCPDGSQDDNVFDIEQGVAIGLFRRIPGSVTSSVRHGDLWGERETKSDWLGKHTLINANLGSLSPSSPYHFFVPRDESNRQEYDAATGITDIASTNVAGIITARDDFVTGLNKDSLLGRIEEFRDLTISDNVIRQSHFLKKGSPKYPAGDSRSWKLPQARKKVAADRDWRNRISTCLYRPFDIRFIYYVPWMVDWPRPEIMRHMLIGNNLGLSMTRSVEIGRGFEHVFVTRKMIQHHTVSLKEVNYLFPLYLYSESGKLNGTEREPNLSTTFTNALVSNLGLTWQDDGYGNLCLGGTVGPEDVLHYVYSQLHSPSYRRRYSEFLKADFPRIFLMHDLGLFRSLCQLGADLVAVHLLEDDYAPASWNQSNGRNPLRHPLTTLAGQGDTVVAKGHPKYNGGKVFIHPTRWFEGVPEHVWAFHVGGYQVCEKWLKDRKGRILSNDDIAHYYKIVVALNETIRLMREIDEVINQHGGWPGAFVIQAKRTEEGQ